MSMQRFTVYSDPDSGGLIVAERRKALSFAMVPTGHAGGFYTDDDAGRRIALGVASRLTAFCKNGGSVEVRMIETPGRFEEVAEQTE